MVRLPVDRSGTLAAACIDAGSYGDIRGIQSRHHLLVPPLYIHAWRDLQAVFHSDQDCCHCRASISHMRSFPLLLPLAQREGGAVIATA
jgi:hypothetical protein